MQRLNMRHCVRTWKVGAKPGLLKKRPFETDWTPSIFCNSSTRESTSGHCPKMSILFVKGQSRFKLINWHRIFLWLPCNFFSWKYNNADYYSARRLFCQKQTPLGFLFHFPLIMWLLVLVLSSRCQFTSHSCIHRKT